MSDNTNIFPNLKAQDPKEYAAAIVNKDRYTPFSSKPNTESTILSGVIADLRAREAKGIQTYGTTLETANLTRRQRLQHLYEELLDSCMYIKNEIDAIDNEAA